MVLKNSTRTGRELVYREHRKEACEMYKILREENTKCENKQEEIIRQYYNNSIYSYPRIA